MKKKATCTTFVNILNTIHEKGITSKAALLADQLYTDFWFALKDFCHFALLSKTGGKNNEGEILLGNSGKIDALEIRGVTTRDEIETDCVIKIIEKLDLVLRQPIEKQKNYCYTICNNMVNDCFRRLPPNDFKVVPFNGTIEGSGIDAEDAYTYEDIITDNTYHPELLYFEGENIKELKKELERKKAREQSEKREAILREVALLSKRPAEVLIHLCAALGMKSSTIAAFMIENGVVESSAKILMSISHQFDIPIIKMQDYIQEGVVSEKDLKLDTNDREKVTSQIYHLRSRAKKRIGKTNK